MHRKLNPKLNPYYWTDGEAPPGTKPGEVIKNPHTGEVITDELYYLALLHGLAQFKYPDKRVQLASFIDAHRVIRQAPVYPVLNDEQVEILRKLKTADVIADVFWLARLYGCSRWAAVRRLAKWHVPVYMGMRGMEFFVSDLARAISARKIDLLANGEAELRYLVKEDRRLHRAHQRRKGSPPPSFARDEEDPPSGGPEDG